MLDLAAINKVELLPWDSWGTSGGPGWKPTPNELDEIDGLADVIVQDDLDRDSRLLRATVRAITDPHVR